MKYTVSTTFAGCMELDVEADSEEQAAQKADDLIFDMEPNEFMENITLDPMGQSISPAPQEEEVKS